MSATTLTMQQYSTVYNMLSFAVASMLGSFAKEPAMRSKDHLGAWPISYILNDLLISSLVPSHLVP